MAFSLQGFGAGFANTLTQRINEDRMRQERLQDEATSLATRQRLAKQAEREAKQEQIDEYTGLLTSLGIDPKYVEAIAKSGLSGLKLHAGYAQTAFEQGKDYNSFLSVAPTVDLNNSETSEIISGATETKTETEAAIPTGAEKSPATIGGIGLDRDMLSGLFPKKSEANSYAQMKAQALDLKLKAEQAGDTELANQYANRIKSIMEQESLEAKDTIKKTGEYKPHSPSSVNSLYTSSRAAAGQLLQQSVGELGQITSDLMGNLMIAPMQEYLAYALMKQSAVEEDKTLLDFANGRQSMAIDGVSKAAQNKFNEFKRLDNVEPQPNGTVTGLDGVKYYKAPKSKAGDVVDVSKVNPAASLHAGGASSSMNYGDTVVIEDTFGNTRIVVYTGVPNPLAEGAPYLIIQ